jgi:hypothetical protein
MASTVTKSVNRIYDHLSSLSSLSSLPTSLLTLIASYSRYKTIISISGYCDKWEAARDVYALLPDITSSNGYSTNWIPLSPLHVPRVLPCVALMPSSTNDDNDNACQSLVVVGGTG